MKNEKQHTERVQKWRARDRNDSMERRVESQKEDVIKFLWNINTKLMNG